jgi:hypothetical protein
MVPVAGQIADRGECAMIRLVVLVLLVAGCSAAPTATPEPIATERSRAQAVDDYVRVHGGLGGVYRTILEETDCAEIQELFYTATDNGSLGYQAAAMDRAADLGCPTLLFTRP